MSNASSRADDRSRFWSLRATMSMLGRLVFAVVLFVGSQIIALNSVLTIANSIATGTLPDDWLDTSVNGQFAYIFIAEAIVISGILFFLRLKQELPKSIGITVFKSRFLLHALTGYIVYFIAFLALAAFVQSTSSGIDFEQEQQVGFETAKTTLQLVLTYISLAILPPLAEEVLFRGFLFSAFRKYIGFFSTTIIVSLLFAAGHLQFGSGAPLLWVAALDTLVLSVVLCFIREKTGSIWPGVIIHAVKNSLAFVVLFLVST